MTVLPNLAQELEAARAEIARLKAQAVTGKLSLKVGQSGTVCLYHGARYPIALYAEQWERLIPFIKSGKIEEFMAANAALLSRKGE